MLRLAITEDDNYVDKGDDADDGIIMQIVHTSVLPVIAISLIQRTTNTLHLSEQERDTIPRIPSCSSPSKLSNTEYSRDRS